MKKLHRRTFVTGIMAAGCLVAAGTSKALARLTVFGDSSVAASGWERVTVKWFNHECGYGFISPDNGAPDIFVHMDTLRRYAACRSLRVGDELLVRIAKKPGD